MSEETLCHWIAPQLEPAPLGLLRMIADDVGVTHLPGAPGPVFVPDKLG